MFTLYVITALFYHMWLIILKPYFSISNHLLECISFLWFIIVSFFAQLVAIALKVLKWQYFCLHKNIFAQRFLHQDPSLVGLHCKIFRKYCYCKRRMMIYHSSTLWGRQNIRVCALDQRLRCTCSCRQFLWHVGWCHRGDLVLQKPKHPNRMDFQSYYGEFRPLGERNESHCLKFVF